jgi:hypothetical protein
MKLATLHRPPLLGILALLLVSLWRVVAHNVVVLENSLLPESVRLTLGAAFGIAGFVLVWRGLERDELTSSLMGLAGGALIWMGWFEHGFEAFAKLMAVPPLVWNGQYALPPNLVLLQGCSVILLALLLFLGMNKDTGCRMFLWVRRHLRLDPGPPTRGYRKAYSRIAALEYVLVSWFMYAVILLLLDPRVLGARHPLTLPLAAALALWALYLAIACMPRQTGAGGAVRYAIGAGGIVWLVVELGAQLRLFPEIWVRPLERPFLNASFWVAFALLAWVVARAPDRGQPAVGA